MVPMSKLWHFGMGRTEQILKSCGSRFTKRLDYSPTLVRGLKRRSKGCTDSHGGKEQLVRQSSGSDIVSSYTDDEVRSLVREMMPIALLTALLTTAVLDYPAE